MQSGRSEYVEATCQIVGAFLATVMVLLAATGSPGPALAASAQRHALLVGVGDFQAGSGLARLPSPKHDLETMRAALENRSIGFKVDVLIGNDVSTPDTFRAGFRKFLDRVRPGDEVLFYFSGYGMHVPGRGNHFLLSNAKSPRAFQESLGAADRRTLDTADKRDSAYATWLTTVAISEDDVLTAISQAKADVTILIAEAGNTPSEPKRGFQPVSGIVLPNQAPSGLFRIYAAGPGQMSLDLPGGKSGSLFTSVFAQELATPLVDINILFGTVKIKVREFARNLGVEQVPDFSDNQYSTLYYFNRGGENSKVLSDNTTKSCDNAYWQFQEASAKVAQGLWTRADVERLRDELAPCGVVITHELTVLMKSAPEAAGSSSPPEPSRKAIGALEVPYRAAERAGAPVEGSLKLYGRSKALVIGIDAYSEPGWPKLNNAFSDAKAVGDALKAQGFEVTLKRDLKSDDLDRTLKDFFIIEGSEKDSRLLLWFAGHGHTVNGEGYIVPADAAGPASDSSFRRKAISLRRFGEYMREANSKHVLAIFDSCFAGTVFNVVTRASANAPPPAITLATAEPVRQFVSSGDVQQEVSDDGTFRKLFLDALLGKEPAADLNHDGYITGTELGLFLQDKITNLSEKRQTPRYGKLNAMGFDRGDFVFEVSTPKSASASAITSGRDKASLTRQPTSLSDADVIRICKEVEGLSLLTMLTVLEREYRDTPAAACVSARISELNKTGK